MNGGGIGKAVGRLLAALLPLAASLAAAERWREGLAIGGTVPATARSGQRTTSARGPEGTAPATARSGQRTNPARGPEGTAITPPGERTTSRRARVMEPPPMPAAPRGAASDAGRAGLWFDLVPITGGELSGRLVAAGEALFTWPAHRSLALELRLPFLLRPGAMGGAGLGLAWALHRQEERTRTVLLATVRLHAPTAPLTGDAGVAAANLARTRPFSGPSWEQTFTAAPGLAWRFATARYAVTAEASVQAATTGPYAAQVAIAYLLAAEVKLPAAFGLGAEVGGRAIASGGEPGERSFVGLAFSLRRRFGPLAPVLVTRVPIGIVRQFNPVLVELGLEAAF